MTMAAPDNLAMPPAWLSNKGRAKARTWIWIGEHNPLVGRKPLRVGRRLMIAPHPQLRPRLPTSGRSQTRAGGLQARCNPAIP